MEKKDCVPRWDPIRYTPNPKPRRRRASIAKSVFLLGCLVFACLFALGCEAEILTDQYLNQPELQEIVGGSPTEYQIWKGAVGIMIPMGINSYSICTATLIDPEVILSAGHCVYLPPQGIDVLHTPGNINIVGGSNMDIHYAVASEVVKHPNWNGDIYSPTRVDLSVIKLASPIEHIEPYPVDTIPLTKGTKGVIVGYGNSSDSGGAGVHRYGETTVLTVTGTEFELGNPAGTCLGDSGGPLFVDRGDNDWAVAGVSSYGVGYGCSAMDSSWDVYILEYRDWIGDVVEEMTGRSLIDLQVDTDEDTETAADSQVESDDTEQYLDTLSDEEDDTVLDSEAHAETDSDTQGGYPDNPILDSDIGSPWDPKDPGENLFGDGGMTSMPFGMNQRNPVDCGCALTGKKTSSKLLWLLHQILG